MQYEFIVNNYFINLSIPLISYLFIYLFTVIYQRNLRARTKMQVFFFFYTLYIINKLQVQIFFSILNNILNRRQLRQFYCRSIVSFLILERKKK